MILFCKTFIVISFIVLICPLTNGAWFIKFIEINCIESNWWKIDNYLNLNSALKKISLSGRRCLLFKKEKAFYLNTWNMHPSSLTQNLTGQYADSVYMFCLCSWHSRESNKIKFELHCKLLTPIIQKTRVFGFLSQIFNLWQLYIDGNLITVHSVSHLGT